MDLLYFLHQYRKQNVNKSTNNSVYADINLRRLFFFFIDHSNFYKVKVTIPGISNFLVEINMC